MYICTYAIYSQQSKLIFRACAVKTIILHTCAVRNVDQHSFYQFCDCYYTLRFTHAQSVVLRTSCRSILHILLFSYNISRMRSRWCCRLVTGRRRTSCRWTRSWSCVASGRPWSTPFWPAVRHHRLHLRLVHEVRCSYRRCASTPYISG